LTGGPTRAGRGGIPGGGSGSPSGGGSARGILGFILFKNARKDKSFPTFLKILLRMTEKINLFLPSLKNTF
jgi:hypothetical protein